MIEFKIIRETAEAEAKEFERIINGGATPASIYDDVAELQTNVAAIETAINGTPWETLPLLNGAVAYNASQTPQYKKIGNHVFIRGVFKGITERVVIAQLPVGFRPSQRIILCYPRTGYAVTKFEIETDGTIKYVGFGDAINANTWFSFSDTNFFTN